jgi:hypothetical protein
MKRRYNPDPYRQRRQAHRRRLALPRALHQIRSIRRPWMRAWNKFQLRGGTKPQVIALPRLLKNHRVRLHKVFISGR